MIPPTPSMKMFPDMFLPASVRDIPQYSACRGTKGMHQAEDKSVMIEQYPSASIVRCFLAHDHYRKSVNVGQQECTFNGSSGSSDGCGIKIMEPSVVVLRFLTTLVSGFSK